MALAVVNSSAGDYVFMYPLFSGGWTKNDQLRMLSKFGMPPVANGMMGCMHLYSNLPRMRTKKCVQKDCDIKTEAVRPLCASKMKYFTC